MLGPYTTLKIGGPAGYFCRVTSEDELVEAVRFARERELPLFVLGGGSNLVVKDAGFPGLALQVAIDGDLSTDTGEGCVRFAIPAGMDWNDFVALTCQLGITGVECLAGIPGTVGGSPVQNIGAYGQDVSQTIVAVRAFDREANEFVELSAAACEFSYRRSIFNSSRRGRYIVTKVMFELDRDETKLNYAELRSKFEGKAQPTPSEIYDAVRQIRAGKGMLIDPAKPDADSRSAGSFFKNPVVKPRVLKDILETLAEEDKPVPHWPMPTGDVKIAAAWLIEKAGFKKGFALGRVGISSKHTLALVNRTGDATCEELLRLRDLIVLTVEQRFGVTLEQEPVMLG